MTDIVAELREATRPLHDRLECHALAQAMIDGTIPRPRYVALLGQLRLLHDALEQAWETEPACAAVFDSSMKRLAVLDADFARLGETIPATPLPPLAAFLRRVEVWRVGSPWALLGPLYVLEGSRMGSLVLARPLAKALGVSPAPGHGLDYHLVGSQGRHVAWNRFLDRLRRLPLSEEQRAAVCEAAVATFAVLGEIFENLAHDGATLTNPIAVGEPKGRPATTDRSVLPSKCPFARLARMLF
jgi:heme oxygenase